MINTYFGRLVFDVKVDTVNENKRVLNNRLAIRITKEQTTFIDIVAWGGTAELIGKNYKKGSEILLQGRLINNKKVIAKNVETDNVAILVDDVIFTYGNKRDNNEYEDEKDFI